MQYIYSFFVCLVIVSTSGFYLLATDPCPIPVRYSIGQVDDRFNYDREALERAARAAEQVWEKEIGQELFILDPDSSFAVNLVYDERQQEARTEEEWRLRLNAKEARTVTLQQELDGKNQSYNQEQRQYQDERSRYEERLDAYNEKVEEYNQLGGAPEEVYSELERERKSLNQALTALQKLEKILNPQVDEINRLADQLNALVDEYNQEVNRYNAIYGSREAYTQGDFDRERINIYKFSNEAELVKVLVHEFGHALGLDHVEDEKAIMYHLMDDARVEVSPTEADLQAFTLVCSGQNDNLHKLRQLTKKVLSYSQ